MRRDEVNEDHIAGLVLTLQEPLAEFILHSFLQKPSQGSCPIFSIVAAVGQVVAGCFCQFHMDAHFIDPPLDVFHQQVDDVAHLFLCQPLENNRLVNTVQKFRPEETLHLLAIFALHERAFVQFWRGKP